MNSWRNKLAEVLVMIAVEWIGTPEWRENWHNAEEENA